MCMIPVLRKGIRIGYQWYTVLAYLYSGKYPIPVLREGIRLEVSEWGCMHMDFGPKPGRCSHFWFGPP